MDSIDQARAIVLKMLTEGMKMPVRIKENGSLLVTVKGYSTAAYLHFREQEFGGTAPKQSFLNISAPLLRNVPESADLYKWIAINGTGFRLGSIEVFVEEGGTLFLLYRHTLLVDYLTQDELDTALWAVLATANEMDEWLKKTFGGKRWVDGDELPDA
jgi:hypothetical protein